MPDSQTSPSILIGSSNPAVAGFACSAEQVIDSRAKVPAGANPATESLPYIASATEPLAGGVSPGTDHSSEYLSSGSSPGERVPDPPATTPPTHDHLKFAGSVSPPSVRTPASAPSQNTPAPARLSPAELFNVGHLDGTVDGLCEQTGLSYRQALDKVRAAGYGIAFNTTEVPLEMRQDPKLIGFELTCALDMMAEEFRTSACLHEAAHAEYMERCSFVRAALLLPPHAFVKNDGDLGYANVAVIFIFSSPNQGNLEYVKSILAAGIAEEVLTASPTGGTEYDEHDLEQAFNKSNVPAAERKRLCEQARAEILKDLRSPAFRARLWKRTAFFKRILENDIRRAQRINKARDLNIF